MTTFHDTCAPAAPSRRPLGRLFQLEQRLAVVAGAIATNEIALAQLTAGTDLPALTRERVLAAGRVQREAALNIVAEARSQFVLALVGVA
jgi:hypothetical protein